jgi:hypothetical protein
MRVILDTVTKTVFKTDESQYVAYVKIVDDAGSVIATHDIIYNPEDEKAFTTACQQKLNLATEKNTDVITARTKIETLITTINTSEAAKEMS